MFLLGGSQSRSGPSRSRGGGSQQSRGQSRGEDEEGNFDGSKGGSNSLDANGGGEKGSRFSSQQSKRSEGDKKSADKRQTQNRECSDVIHPGQLTFFQSTSNLSKVLEHFDFKCF